MHLIEITYISSAPKVKLLYFGVAISWLHRITVWCPVCCCTQTVQHLLCTHVGTASPLIKVLAGGDLCASRRQRSRWAGWGCLTSLYEFIKAWAWFALPMSKGLSVWCEQGALTPGSYLPEHCRHSQVVQVPQTCSSRLWTITPRNRKLRVGTKTVSQGKSFGGHLSFRVQEHSKGVEKRLKQIRHV